MRAFGRLVAVILALAFVGGCAFAPSDYPPQAAEPSTGSAGESSAAPLAVLRLERQEAADPTVLSAAALQALARQPASRFALVAVAPGDSAAPFSPQLLEASATAYRSLLAAGVAAERLSLSATTDPSVGAEELRLLSR
jgi:hypothetical protein